MSAAFVAGAALRLPDAAARHVRVLRLQPGDPIALFDGNDDRDWPATIARIGKDGVDVSLAEPVAAGRELPFDVTLAVAIPAGDRMDGIVEKAGELGAAAIAPLVSTRGVVRLAGERAESRRRHWAGVAVAASEQCGRARIASIGAVRTFAEWIEALPAEADERRIVLSLSAEATGPQRAVGDPIPLRGAHVLVLSGPEGGLTADEEGAALSRGFVRVGLGPRVLRADTAPIAFLAWLALHAGFDR